MSNQRETAERVAAAIMDRIEMDRAIHKSALADVIEASMARLVRPAFEFDALEIRKSWLDTVLGAEVPTAPMAAGGAIKATAPCVVRERTGNTITPSHPDDADVNIKFARDWANAVWKALGSPTPCHDPIYLDAREGLATCIARASSQCSTAGAARADLSD